MLKEYPEMVMNRTNSENCRLIQNDVLPKKVNMMPISKVKELTGLSYNYLRVGCIKGTIPHTRAGNRYYINYDRLVEILSRGNEDGE